MRQIEKAMNSAIVSKTSWASGNTRVDYLPAIDTPLHARIEMAKVYLHNNHIATVCYELSRTDYNPVTLKRWPTRTTFSRLNALGIRAGMRKGIIYIGDKAL
jgi:hypothetical protein